MTRSLTPFSFLPRFSTGKPLAGTGAAPAGTGSNMKHVTAYVVAFATLVVGCNALAIGGVAQVTIVDRDTGAVLTPHYYRGEYWVAGRPGANYAVEIHNRLGERVLAVASVDGVNVVSGETANWNQTGYVLNPEETYQITGWRKSDTEIAAFTFTDSPNSYAELTGRPANVGVIGVAIFRERPAPRVTTPEFGMTDAPNEDVTVTSRLRSPDRGTAVPSAAPSSPDSINEVTVAPSAGMANRAAPTSSAATAPTTRTPANSDSVPHAERSAASPVPPRQATPAASAPMPPASLSRDVRRPEPVSPPEPASPKLGTGHGDRGYSFVTHVEFTRRQDRPNQVIRIRYDSLDNLVAMGIIPHPRPHAPAVDPFPGSPGQHYVPDPPTAGLDDVR